MNFGPYPEKREIPSFVQKQSGEELALKLLRQHDALDALHRKEISDVQKRADRLAEQLALLVHKKRFTENDPFVMSLRQLLKNEGITLRTYVGEEVTDVLEDEADIVEWLPPGEDTVDRVEDALEPEIHWQGNLLHRAKLSCRQAAEDVTEEEESASAELAEEYTEVKAPEAEAVKAPEEAVLKAPEAEAESAAEEPEEMAEEAAEAAKEAAEQSQIPSSDGLSEDADQEAEVQGQVPSPDGLSEDADQEAGPAGESDTAGDADDSEYPDKEEYSGDEYFDDDEYYDDEEDPEDDEYSEDDEFFDEEEYLDGAGKPDDAENPDDTQDSDQDPDQSGFFSRTLDRIRRWLNGE